MTNETQNQNGKTNPLTRMVGEEHQGTTHGDIDYHNKVLQSVSFETERFFGCHYLIRNLEYPKSDEIVLEYAPKNNLSEIIRYNAKSTEGFFGEHQIGLKVIGGDRVRTSLQLNGEEVVSAEITLNTLEERIADFTRRTGRAPDSYTRYLLTIPEL